MAPISSATVKAVQTPGNYTQKLESALAATGVTGASFAYWDGATLHTAAAGLRNSVTRDPITVDTVMHIGSITKVLNASLMMQLVDDGKIELDVPVIKHLPELRVRDMESLKRVTCRMLINHTSGINCDWLPEYGPDQERIVDAIDRCVDIGQLHPPGEALSYCNIGTVIAGYLTQRVRGESWYTVAKARIYEPLGMRHSLVDPLDIPRFRCSVGDVTDSKTGKPVQTDRPFLSPSFAPAGSTQMTSATDQITFARALINGGVGPNGVRILSEKSAALMAQPKGDFFHPVGWQMGLGWIVLPGNVLHHGGGGRGVVSMLYAHPESGRALALLTNCDRGLALQPYILDPIVESWTGISTPTARRQKVSFDTDPYVGVYENNLFRYEVFARDGGLALHAGTPATKMGDIFDNDAASAAKLHSLGNNVFEQEYSTPGLANIFQGELFQLRFVHPDAEGRMQYLAFGPRLLVRTGER